VGGITTIENLLVIDQIEPRILLIVYKPTLLVLEAVVVDIISARPLLKLTSVMMECGLCLVVWLALKSGSAAALPGLSSNQLQLL
jgi:hypothetical protein